jgi:starch synthase
MKPIRALSVASELFPLIKTGGLADVAGALPAALAAENVEVVTLVPGYPTVLSALETPRELVVMTNLFGGPASLIRAHAAGHDLLVIDAPHLYAGAGNPYMSPDGRDRPDNAQRFAGLAWVAAEIGRGLVPDYRPQVIHAHDWQAALVPAYLHYAHAPAPPVVLTIHNLAFQGSFPSGLLGDLRLPDSAMAIDGVEYYGSIGFLKAGILFADRITTVSPGYAADIVTEAGGMGLGGLLAARGEAVTGILNGIDEIIWDPATDPLIPATFAIETIERRAGNKAALQERFGLTPDRNAPVFGVVSRMSEQKGLDLLLANLPTILARNGQLALIGSGDIALENSFRDAAARHPGRIGCVIGYDEATAHLVQAGADMLLVPSRFEPCGLTQLCALRYGAVPVVARTGGLADTIIDANPAGTQAGVATGFCFSPIDANGLSTAIRRSIAAFAAPDVWRTLQRNGMSADVSWRRPAKIYAELYRGLVETDPTLDRIMAD